MARLSGFHLEGGIGKTMLDLVRPVNSLYLTVGSEDPNTVFGGTWVKLTGGVLACAGTAGYAAAGAVGGSKKISVGQMPSHIHSGTRSVTTTLRENVEGSENFALSGVVEDSLYTFDAWTNATGGGRTTTRSTSPSTSGRGRRSAGGGRMTALSYSQNGAKKNLCPYAVGDVYVTMSAVNPATRWGDTTWELVAAGTFLVAGAASGTYKVGNTGGEAAHKLTVNEMPSHAHNVEWPQWTGTDGSPGNGFAYTGNTAIVASASVGGNAAHNNMPPWLAVYMWKRTGGGNRNVAPCGEAVPYAA